MIRVLQVVTHMNRGGLETMLMNYYRHMDRSQVQFDFLVHRKERADYDDEIEALGGKIYRLPVLNPFSKIYKKELRQFFKEHPEYKVVHVHQDCMSSVVLKEAKAQNVQCCVAHSHSASQDKNVKYLIKMYYRREIPKYSDYLFACSQNAGEWMFRGTKFQMLNNAIDASKYIFDMAMRNKMRKFFGISDDTILIGHVGNFTRPKNHSFLIDIFESISKKTKTKLILVGDGLLRKEIEEKVKYKGLENKVLFLGSRKDVPDLLQMMDVFVFPSTYEGLPVTMIEAQAAGLSCFISDKVSIECKRTDLVQQIPLTAGADYWADEILKAKMTSRKDTYEEIKVAGFDIQENAKKLQQFYIRAYEGEKNLCLH